LATVAPPVRAPRRQLPRVPIEPICDTSGLISSVLSVRLRFRICGVNDAHHATHRGHVSKALSSKSLALMAHPSSRRNHVRDFDPECLTSGARVCCRQARAARMNVRRRPSS
jgi:hypothetical protein